LPNRLFIAALLLGATFAAPFALPLGAQSLQIKPFVQFETRSDVIFGSPSALQLALGANVPIDPYVRFGAIVGGGTSWQDGRSGASARADVTVRYLLDPYAETRWGVYGGGGISARWDRDPHWRTFLLLVGGVEAPAHGGWRTSLELGIGGGARVGIVLRRARLNWR
jgi:hypothetical protein